MRARLLVIVLTLVGLLAVGLGVPLAIYSAQAAQSKLFTNRLTDTVYLASLAVRPLTEADTTGLDGQLRRFDETFGVAVVVVDATRTVVASSRIPVPELDEKGQERLALALAARPSQPYPLLAPWDDQPMVLAEPVLDDTEVRGAVITISPTQALHTEQLIVWFGIAAAGVLALALAVLVALPIVRWILRPVRRLDEGTGRVAAAVLAGAAPEAVSDNSGPPELRRLTLSFDRMAATVAQAYAAQRAFVADASHQLRNPLTALRLRLSNLEGHVAPEAVEDHAAALEEAERLSTLLDGLLALARAERTVPLAVQAVDAPVADRVEAWRPLAEHTGITLERKGARGLRVIAPAGAIETVLDAVLDNAVKYTPPGGRITVSTAVAGADRELVEISVRDTGPGLAPDQLERATGRFWRAPGQDNVEGSGLGLAIAARTLEVGGGSLRLDLPEGGGLRVTAVLSRARVPAAADQASLASR
ncbi:Signal transduction histidine kinase [Pseudonocardia thermophila]|uniref:histidine kinase n=1 Tax=Pseudonocardia thermophila TaxID=1848 RepID=A0A1M6QVX6_PSETH|nr:HAMP domain-containing sensor histidine kinase [Pseudonocardia thermophila]SHK24273.1 Signal transduction histidine kinase [Pseudonocardia thermophila]